MCLQLWSCICCCSNSNNNKDEAQARSQHGTKGKVHPVTKIEKWEEKMTEANNNGMIVSFLLLFQNMLAFSWILPLFSI